MKNNRQEGIKTQANHKFFTNDRKSVLIQIGVALLIALLPFIILGAIELRAYDDEFSIATLVIWGATFVTGIIKKKKAVWVTLLVTIVAIFLIAILSLLFGNIRIQYRGYTPIEPHPSLRIVPVINGLYT